MMRSANAFLTGERSTSYQSVLVCAVVLIVLSPLGARAQALGPILMHLTERSRPCTMPAPFNLIDATVGYSGNVVAGGKKVDPRSPYRTIDFDGDGRCEVLAETCNVATGVRNGEALMCPETWLAPLKFKDDAWHAAYDIGTGSGTERWRGDVTFFYFDRDTGRLKVDAEHNFFADASALPGMVVRIREASSRQVKQIDYDVHSEWRLQHCGSPNGSWRKLCQ